MKKSILIAGSILVGSLILGLLIADGMATDRYEYVESNVVFDKKTGITYFTDKKEYLDTKGDLYLYE
jgi:hypothetical protein